MKRVATAAVLLPLFFAAVLAENSVWFAALAALASLLAAHEYFGLAEALGEKPFRLMGYAWALMALLSVWLPERIPPVLVAVTGALAVGVLALFSKMDLARVLGAVATTAFGSLYLGVLPGCMLALKELGGARGTGFVLLACTAVWAGDSFAYYGGRLLGRHKLAPRVSPKKTWEGAIIGAIGSLAAGAVAPLTYFKGLPIAHALIIAAVVSVIGPLGDLFESALKRGAGVKDSSSLLPGHGGVLDRLDSLLFAAPAVLLYQKVFLP